MTAPGILRETGTKRLISIRGLNHHFGEGALRRQVLFDIALDIAPGEIVILTGPSGSGKTTLLTLCGALRKVQDGSVRILDIELRNAKSSAMGWVRERVGVIFQTHHLLDALSARQNVALSLGLDGGISRAERYKRAEAMLDAVGLSGLMRAFPSELSGGQKQRVAVARALVRNPSIILADEPTASLDRKSGREVIELLQSIARGQGCAVLLVTHDNRILDIADRIVTLEDGRLAAFASEVAMSAGNMLQAFARLQRSGNLRKHVQAISSRQYFEMLEHMTAEFQQYFRVFQIGSREALTELFDTVLEAITLKMVDAMRADRGTLYLVDREAGLLRSRIAKGEAGKPITIEAPISRSVAGRVVITGKCVNIPDAYQCEFFNPEFDRITGYRTRSILCIPVFDSDHNIFAVAQLLNRIGEEAFTPEDERQFATFAEAIGVILASCLHLRSSFTKPELT